jgi:hypothetical protein
MKQHDKHHDNPKHMKTGGGVTNANLKKFGRNLARALNQKAASHKSGGRGR